MPVFEVGLSSCVSAATTELAPQIKAKKRTTLLRAQGETKKRASLLINDLHVFLVDVSEMDSLLANRSETDETLLDDEGRGNVSTTRRIMYPISDYRKTPIFRFNPFFWKKSKRGQELRQQQNKKYDDISRKDSRDAKFLHKFFSVQNIHTFPYFYFPLRVLASLREKNFSIYALDFGLCL